MNQYIKLDGKLALKPGTAEILQQKFWTIDGFKFDFSKLNSKSELFLRELRELATIASIGSSTRIEGSALTDAEVRELINNLDINKLKTRDQEEVVGYYEVLDLIHSSYTEIQLSEANLKYLHQLLLKYSSKDTRHRGEYKALSNKVVAKYPGGIEKVIFNTTEPFLTPKEISELISWINIKLADSNYHPLLVIAIFVYEFLSIHPFQDGNGRLSRLLTNLLLLRAGYSFVEYISFEHVIEERKKFYYQALMEGQKNRYSAEEDLTLWLMFFTDCLESMIDRLKAKLEHMQTIQIKSNYPENINDRQELILNFIKEKRSARMKDLIKQFPDFSRSILNRELKILVANGLLKQHGELKATYYTLA